MLALLSFRDAYWAEDNMHLVLHTVHNPLDRAGHTTDHHPADMHFDNSQGQQDYIKGTPFVTSSHHSVAVTHLSIRHESIGVTATLAGVAVCVGRFSGKSGGAALRPAPADAGRRSAAL